MYLVAHPEGLMPRLARALLEADEKLTCCSLCGAITEKKANPCPLCTQPREEQNVICVVEGPADIIQIEAAGVYRGRYHALMGKLSAMRGIGTSRLRVDSLLSRIEQEHIHEVILAMGGDVESEATVSYLRERLEPLNIMISRPAFSASHGSALELLNSSSLAAAFLQRRPFL